MKIVTPKQLGVFLMALLAGTAHAHTGHGAFSFFEGVVHPLGWDHLLAMIAVGMWSVFALPARQAAWGPVTFLVMMLVGAVAGLTGGSVANLETWMALSVVLLAVMLLVPLVSVSRWATGLGILVVAASALLHGLAHGMEVPAGVGMSGGVSGYVLGFVFSTALIHLSGFITAGLARRAWSARTASVVLGTALGGAGMYLLGQLV